MSFLLVASASADDLQLQTTGAGLGDSQFLAAQTPQYSLYDSNVQAVVTGSTGLTGTRDDIRVEPARMEIEVVRQRTATQQLRILNLGSSTARVDVTLRDTSDSQLINNVYFDGELELTNQPIASTAYRNNYRDITVTADATSLNYSQRTVLEGTIDVLSSNGERHLVRLRVIVLPEEETTIVETLQQPVFSVTGAATQEVCVTDATTGEQQCRPDRVRQALGALTWLRLSLLVAVLGGLGWFLAARRRRRREDGVLITEDDTELVRVIRSDAFDGDRARYAGERDSDTPGWDRGPRYGRTEDGGYRFR